MDDQGSRADQARELVGELRRMLEDGAAVDSDLEQSLQELLDEVHGALDQARGTGEPPTLAERIEVLVLEFEASHPTLAGVVNRLTHQLASLGF